MEIVEFVNLRVRAKGKNRPITFSSGETEIKTEKSYLKGKRNVYFEHKGWEMIPIFDRYWLPEKKIIAGPAIIEEAISTTLIPPDSSGVIDEFGNIIIKFETENY